MAATSVCARVGRSLAEQVRSQVCIVDANLRFPGVGRLLDQVPPEPETQVPRWYRGRSAIIFGWFAVTRCRRTVRALLQTSLQSCVRDLGDEFAYAVINAPPVGLYNDAVLLGQMADGVVLVVEANSTRRAATQRAKQALEANSVRVLGSVLNNRTFPIPEKLYRLL